MGGSRASVFGAAAATLALVAAACTSGPGAPGSSDRARDGAVTVGSFDFQENELLAELYSQALEEGGFEVRRAFDLGPREYVAPALAGGLIDLVPEYAGTAVQFLSLGAVAPGPDPGATHDALVRSLAATELTALAPAPAQTANTFVVSGATAARYGLRQLSDLQAVAPQLTFGGPPECPSRPLCLAGLERVYGLRFGEVVALDAGGPLTRQALQGGGVDVALLFTTDPAIARLGLVELADDRRLQPAENITPLARKEAVARHGGRLVDLIDAVSRSLTTDDVRELNGSAAEGRTVGEVVAGWRRAKGGP